MFLGPSDEAVNIYHALGSPRRDGVQPSGAEPFAADGDGEDSEVSSYAQQDRQAAAPRIAPGLGQFQDEIGTREAVITGCGIFDGARSRLSRV